jgi:SNF2 family DNA or RNA helicase
MIASHRQEKYSSASMPFGKYKGVAIKNIADRDPDYLRWVNENVNLFSSELKDAINQVLKMQEVIQEGGIENIEIPLDLPDYLMSHQKKGVALADKHNKYALFFSTGIGKTATAIEIIARKKVKTLVVAPISVIESAWIEDINKFNPSLKAVNLYPLSAKKRLAALAEDYDVFLINFEGFKVNYSEIQEADFRMLIVDESSKMKSPQTQISVLLNSFAKKMDYTYLLSGTPAPNTPMEYFMQIDALHDGLLGSNFWEFRNRYFFQPDKLKPWKWVISQRSKADLMNKIKKIAIFVSKEDVIDLPEQVFVERRFEMEKLQQKYYNDMLDEIYEDFKDKGFSNKFQTLGKLVKLREITSGFMYEKDGSVKKLGDSKFEELQNLLEEIGHEQVIIWANFKYEIEGILKLLKGKAKALYSDTSKDRDGIIKDFKDGKFQYLVAHPASAGHGLTFTNCSYAVYFSLNYSLELWLQSVDRLHRYGQKRSCTYFILIAKDSIDSVVYRRLMQKKEISADILNSLKKLQNE